MTLMEASPRTQEESGTEDAPVSSPSDFLVALEAAKAALGQPVPESRNEYRAMRQTRKKAKRALKAARKIRLISLARSQPSVDLGRALRPLNRLRSAYKRRRWMLEVRSFALRNWKFLLFLAVLALIWTFWVQLAGILATLAQSVPW